MPIAFRFLLFILSLNFLPTAAFAIEDPRLLPNNKFGVHILFPEEIEEAAKLVNSNGGDWGYVTIPIQAGDRNLAKWQKFMDDAKTLHIIPIVRLATEGDYFRNAAWRKPDFADVLDFVNFLDSLDWPTLNRYVVVFNEPNRADEWGGAHNAYEYASILDYATDVFKSKNQDFFIISAGLDNASANVEGSSDEYSFMQQMERDVSGIFNKVDGVASHSYPNPGFEKPPWVLTKQSISSFRYEKFLADRLSGRSLPIFITETGWSSEKVSKSQIASYYKEAFGSVWSNSNIVAVTPFLLDAGSGPFAQFSLLDRGSQNEIYNALKDIPKIEGKPKILSTETQDSQSVQKTVGLPERDFSEVKNLDNKEMLREKTGIAVKLVKWLLKL